MLLRSKSRTAAIVANNNILFGFIDILASFTLIIMVVLLFGTLIQRLYQIEFYNDQRTADASQQIIDKLLFELGLSNEGSLPQRLTRLYRHFIDYEEESASYDTGFDTRNSGLAAFRIAELEQQLKQLTASLAAAQVANKQQQLALVELGKQLNSALAGKVQELHRYRSEFLQKLSTAMGEHQLFTISGDRYIFPSDVLFSSGSSELSQLGYQQLLLLRDAVLELEQAIQPDFEWIIRVDGHTDFLPLRDGSGRSNWHLSVQRSLAVVEMLIAAGVAPKRLAVAGFGEFHPVATGYDPAALRKNRRIEITLTKR